MYILTVFLIVIIIYYIIDIQYRTINIGNGVCKIRNTWAPS